MKSEMRLLEKSNIYDIVRSHADMERSGGDLGRSVDPLELGLGAVLVGEAGVAEAHLLHHLAADRAAQVPASATPRVPFLKGY